MGFDGAIPFVTSPGIKPLAEAIAYRVLKALSSVVYEESFAAANRLLWTDLLLGGFPEVQPMTHWQWLTSIKNGRRRKALIKAYHELEELGWVLPEYARYISPFVKGENLNWFGFEGAGADCRLARYVARLIQAPHDYTHVIAGPCLKPILYALKERWHSDNWIYYASSTPEKLDHWLRRNAHAVSYFWSDYSSFDATYSRHAWEMLEGIYRRVLGAQADDLFWEVLGIWRCPHGKAKCKKENRSLWYKAEYCNASGRDDTGLANALFNGLALSLSIAAALAGKKVADLVEEDLLRARELTNIAVVGDDSLVCCSYDVKPIEGAIVENLESFGLCVKAQSSYDLVDVTFLGCMPYLVAGQLYWGPTFGRRMFKAFWQRDHSMHLAAWTRGVAEQMRMFQCVPVMCEIAEKVVQLLDKQLVTEVADPNKPFQTRAEPTPRWDASTVDWLCRRYKWLTPQAIYRDLDVVDSIVRLPAVMRSEFFDIAAAADDL